MEEITISKELITEVTKDKTVISRVPGRRADYLYLKPEEIVAEDQYTIKAQINPDKLYVVGGKNPSQPGGLMRGNELLKNYVYETRYDPEQRTQVREQQERTRSAGKPVHREPQQSQQQKQSQQRTQMQQERTRSAGKPVYREPQQPQQQMQPQQRNVTYTPDQFRQLRLGEKHHVDITKYWDIRLGADQMRQLRMMMEDGVDIQQAGYTDPSIRVDQLEELRKTHKGGYTVDYNWKAMDADQMREIRLGMEHGVKTQQYHWPAYSADQMRQLRLGLQAGMDITGYRNPHFTARQMYSIRMQKVWERIRTQLRRLWESFKEAIHLENLGKIRTQVMDKVVNYLENPDVVRGISPKEVPVETMDDRIRDTIQDIKEILVSQELADEAILTDTKLSEQMDNRIRSALDDLVKPETIANVEKQDAVIQQAADDILKDTGVTEKVEQQETELKALEQQKSEQVAQQKDVSLDNKQEIYQAWVDMDIEAYGQVSDKLMADLKKEGMTVTVKDGAAMVVELELQQQIEQQAMELMEQAEQQQMAHSMVRQM